jgi:hypothetical protein
MKDLVIKYAQMSAYFSMTCVRIHTGGELFRVDSQAGDAILKQLWHHSDAILCCSVKTNVIFFFCFFSCSVVLNFLYSIHLREICLRFYQMNQGEVENIFYNFCLLNRLNKVCEGPSHVCVKGR